MKKIVCLCLTAICFALVGCDDFDLNNERQSQSVPGERSSSPSSSSEDDVDPDPVDPVSGCLQNQYNYKTYTESDLDISDCSSVSINYLPGLAGSSYTTNFSSDNVSGRTYTYYRAGYANNYIGVFYAYATLTTKVNPLSLPGSLSNESSICGIKKIDVTYKCEGKVNVLFGQSKDYSYIKTLNSSSSDTTQSLFTTGDVNYFSIETTDANLYIKEITLYYNDNYTDTSYSRYNAPIPHAAPVVYSGELVAGVSQISVPVDIALENDNYVVKTRKTYTYYPFSYVKDHSSELDLSDIAMTEPVDVCNYFHAFGCAPANYGVASGKYVDPLRDNLSLPYSSEVRSVFGSDARTISQYNRTDGYATAVPYYGSKPTYYELDLGLSDSYSIYSRETGRIVSWLDGWSWYKDGPVSVFTDDHYITFREYNNAGLFGFAYDTLSNSPVIAKSRYQLVKGSTISL